MKNFYEKYEFWIWLVAASLAITFYLNFVFSAQAVTIYSTGGNIATTSLSTTQPSLTFWRIASSSIPSPIQPFVLGKIKIEAASTSPNLNVAEPTLLKIIVNGSDKGFRPLVKGSYVKSISEGAYSYNYYDFTADFSTSSITLNPFDNFEIIINHGTLQNLRVASQTNFNSNQSPATPTTFNAYAGSPFYQFGNTASNYPDFYNFEVPRLNQSLISDFTSWRFAFTNSSSSQKSLAFTIYYNQKAFFDAGLGMLVDGSPVNLVTYATGTTEIYIPKLQSLAASTTYVAWIDTYDGSSHSSTTPILFSTSYQTYVAAQPFVQNPFTVNSTSTNWFNLINATSSPFFVDCSPYADQGFFSSAIMDAIGCYIQKGIFQFAGMLVITPPAIQNYLTDSFSHLMNLFPFSIYSSIVNSLNIAVSDVSTSTATLTLSKNTGNYRFNIPIIGTSTLASLIGTTTTETLFTGVRSILWIMTGFGILGLI